MPNKLKFRGRVKRNFTLIEWFDLPQNKRFSVHFTGGHHIITCWMN